MSRSQASRLKADGIFALGAVGKGRVSIGPRPLPESLDTWAAVLAKVGVTHVISLIAEQEVVRYGLEREGVALNELGIAFTRFPIDDFDTPDDAPFRALLESMVGELEQTGHLFIHCAGGVGRAGTTAACLLKAHGMTVDGALVHVSKSRGVTCPETPEQIAFIRDW